MPDGLATPPGFVSSSIRIRTHEPNVRIVITELTAVGHNAQLASRPCSRRPCSSRGCGAGGGDYGGKHPDYASALAGSPPPLAALYRQGDRLLPGGRDAYEKRIGALSGHPVVVNVWASWCCPCREEFPTLQQLSAKFGKRVAFLGVNSEDAEDAAKTFLEEAPVPYPELQRPRQRDQGGLVRSRGFPDTAFYTATASLCHVKQGSTPGKRRWKRTFERYALAAGNCDSG